MEKIEPGEMVKRLTAFIRAEGHFKNVSIENFRKMPGGASREIWSFDCTIDDGAGVRRRAMVLRRDPGAHKIDTSRRNEFMVIRAAFEESVPVPEVFWLSDDPNVLGAAFFIMERIDGETLARRLLRDNEYAKAREVMPSQLAAILAKIHRIDPAKHKLDFLAPADDAAALAGALDSGLGTRSSGRSDGGRRMDVRAGVAIRQRSETGRRPFLARGFLSRLRESERSLRRSRSGAVLGSLRQSALGNNYYQPGSNSYRWIRKERRIG